MDDDHDPGHLTRLIQRAITGDQAAEHQLMGEIYDDLRHLAARIVYRNDSMHPSVLIHELFLKQFRRHGLRDCSCRGHFFAVAADQMRQILFDHFKHKKAARRGGQYKRVPLDDVMDGVLSQLEENNGCDIEQLDAALQRLRNTNERQYQVVNQRFYGGCTYEEIAESLNLTVAVVRHDWRLARAKLQLYLKQHTTQQP